MPRNSTGQYSLPAGNPVADSTVISSTWANPTMGDLANEITQSLDRNGRGGMLVAFKNVDGTKAAPGMTFTTEPSSGIYRAATNDIRMSVGNDDATRWVDDNSQPVGSQRPFQIWDGGAFRDVLYEGGSLPQLLPDGTVSAPSLAFVSETTLGLYKKAAGVLGVAGNLDVTGTLTAGTLTAGSGSVTDSSGAISFGDENLSTTGTLASGALDVTGDLDVSGNVSISGIDIDEVFLGEGAAAKTYLSFGVDGTDTRLMQYDRGTGALNIGKGTVKDAIVTTFMSLNSTGDLKVGPAGAADGVYVGSGASAKTSVGFGVDGIDTRVIEYDRNTGALDIGKGTSKESITTSFMSFNTTGNLSMAGGLRVSNYQATPLTNEGLYGGHPTRGAYIQGHGSTNDFTVANQSGGVALVVPQNTINVEARGSLSVGDDLVFDSVASQDIYQATSGLNLQISGGTSASLGANMVLYGNGHGSAGDWLFRSDVTTRMKLTAAGALSTTTGVLGTISERRFKTEIVEAKSQVDDIKVLASRMKNFVKNDDGLKQLGWIVDEVEDDFPNLIYSEEGMDADGEPDGDTRKGITIGAIQIKAVKALGEALDRIDVLEATIGELLDRIKVLESV